MLLGKYANPFSCLRATTEPPVGRPAGVQSLTCWEGNHQSESCCPLSWVELLSALPEVDSVPEHPHPAATMQHQQTVRFKLDQVAPWFCPPVGNTSIRTDMIAHCGRGGTFKMSFLAPGSAFSLFRLLQEHTTGA